MATTDRLIADLEAGLAAARELVAQSPPGAPSSAANAPAAADTSNMPGGVDSAPVNEGVPASGIIHTVTTEVKAVEHAAAADGLDIIHELKAGASINDVANKLLDSTTAAPAIVKAIADLAKAVL